MEEKEAAAFEINLRLFKVKALTYPKVLSSVRDEERENDVAAKNDKSEGERPGQQRCDVFCRDGFLPYDDGHVGSLWGRGEGLNDVTGGGCKRRQRVSGRDALAMLMRSWLE